MKFKSLLIPLLPLSLIGTSLIPAAAEEISLAATPPVVQATILQYQRDGKVDEIESFTAEGQTWYEAEVKLPQDRDLQIHVRSDGSLIKTSEKIAAADIPVAVRAAVIQSAPKGEIEEVHREIIDGLSVVYKITVDRDEGDDLKLRITENGAVLRLVED